jgi:hypothetical protein
MSEVHRLLSERSGGGFVESRSKLDRAQLASAAREHGARFGELHAPSGKAALLRALRDALALPGYMGSNWDALEEVLAYPEGDGTSPAIVAWHHPLRLADGDAAIFKAILRAAATARASAGDGPLVVVAGPVAPV